MSLSNVVQQPGNTPTTAGAPTASGAHDTVTIRTKLRALIERRPVVAALGLFLANIVLVSSTGAVANTVASAVPQLPDFIAMCAGILGVIVLVSVLGWWRVVGFNDPATWRGLRVLALPAATFALLPFVAGFRPVAPASTAVFILAYALTGFYEEVLYRGVLLHVLHPTGTTRVVFLVSVLFGASHLANVLFRNPFIVLAQAVGAFCDGVGLATLRLRTNTLWFVIGLHTLHDLFLHYTRLPKIPLDVVQDIIMLAYGLYLLRGLRAAERGK